MGITGLWAELEAAASDQALPVLAYDAFRSNHSHLRALRLGIDASLWLFHAQKPQGGFNPGLRMLFYRLAKLLALPILPVFVFDGSKRPSWKRGKHIVARQSPLERNFIVLIKAFGFLHLSAPGEAEAELAWLNSNDYLDAVLTDDVDTLLFGAKTVVRNWGENLSRSAKRVRTGDNAAKGPGNSASSDQASTDEDGNPGHPVKRATENAPAKTQFEEIKLTGNLKDYQVTVYKSEDIQSVPGLGLTRQGLILVALLAGGDYDVQGLFRCGIKIAVRLARCGFGDTLVREFEQCYKERDVSRTCDRFEDFLVDWIDSVRTELRTNSRGILQRCQPSLAAQFTLLTSQESRQVLANYVWPLTSGSQRSKANVPVFRYSPPDFQSIATCTQLLFRWNADTVQKTFRSSLWSGVVFRQLRQQVLELDGEESGSGPWLELVESPASKAIRCLTEGSLRPQQSKPSKLASEKQQKTKAPNKTNDKPLWDSPQGKRITDFFSQATLTSPKKAKPANTSNGAAKSSDENDDDDTGKLQPGDSVILSIGKQRRHAAFDPYTEYSVRVDVTDLVAHVSKVLQSDVDRPPFEESEPVLNEDDEEEVEDHQDRDRDRDGPASRPRLDPNEPLQLWLTETLLASTRSGRGHLAAAKQAAARRKEAKTPSRRAARVKDTSQQQQRSLTDFLRPGPAKPSYQKTTSTAKKSASAEPTSPTKRRREQIRMPRVSVGADTSTDSIEFVGMSSSQARTPAKKTEPPKEMTPFQRAMAEVESDGKDVQLTKGPNGDTQHRRTARGHGRGRGHGRVSVITISDDSF